MIFTNNLYAECLIKPIREGCNHLKIISGYSTSAMAFKHISELFTINKKIKIDLIIGMAVYDGVSLGNHQGFNKLVRDDFKGFFNCSYIFQNQPVHSKVYIWYRDDTYQKSFIGSANYTQNAFLGKNREILTVDTDPLICEYYGDLEKDSVFCDSIESEHLVQIYKDFNYRRNIKKPDEIDSLGETFRYEKRNLEHVKVTFLARDGSLPSISGLNWGQRDRREKNQAYIPLKSDIYSTDFFPGNKIHFTIHTDDNKTLIATRAQENGKAIHTPHNNSLIGEYFRNRLGLPNGAYITKEDLLRYGRTDIDFYKIDDETYYMDFST